jgi:hypothetical protein
MNCTFPELGIAQYLLETRLCFSYDARLLLPSAFQTIQFLRSDKKVFFA